MATSTSKTVFPRSSNNVSNFPLKLHFMLSDLKEDGLDRIASWQPHGLCFIVHKPKEFEEKILPCYFQQTKYTSFQRQLSFYDFRRILDGVDKGGYYHPKFVRGRKELAFEIKRSNFKGSKCKKISNVGPVSRSISTPFVVDSNMILKHPIQAEMKSAFDQRENPDLINQIAFTALSPSDQQTQSNLRPKISGHNDIGYDNGHLRNSQEFPGDGLQTIPLCREASSLLHYTTPGQHFSSLFVELNSSINDTAVRNLLKPSPPGRLDFESTLGGNYTKEVQNTVSTRLDVINKILGPLALFTAINGDASVNNTHSRALLQPVENLTTTLNNPFNPDDYDFWKYAL